LLGGWIAIVTNPFDTGQGPGGRGRTSTYACPQDVEGARYSRDALAKALYSRMFDYIIRRVNDAMYIDDPEALIIGILDIYGFEIFGVIFFFNL
jgi:myosin-1